MLVARIKKSISGAEERVFEKLAGLGPGYAFTNGHVIDSPVSKPGNRRVREFDALLVSSFGVAVLEVKGTALAGPVQPSLNGPWTIGGEPADFYGGGGGGDDEDSPIDQAELLAKMLGTWRSDHRSELASIGMVRALLVIVGRVNMPAQQAGPIEVSSLEYLEQLVMRGPKRPITLGSLGRCWNTCLEQTEQLADCGRTRQS